MPRREHIRNKIKALGYKYRGETERTQKFRKGEHWIYLPKKAIIPETWVRHTLLQAGCSKDEIENFLAECAVC